MLLQNAASWLARRVQPDIYTSILSTPVNVDLTPRVISTEPLPPVPTVDFPAATPTAAPSATPQPQWVFQGPGTVRVPILLYHHIGTPPGASKYYVTPEEFEIQMSLLAQEGYTTITIAMLVNAIQVGAQLPERPVIITFDDGNADNYTNAFPIMSAYGFVGVEYLVARYIGAPNYLSTEQALDLISNGWEIGSHTLTHADLLTVSGEGLQEEVLGSRRLFEQTLNISPQTLSYPYGSYNSAVMNAAYSAGYTAAMGLGNSCEQHSYNLFALHRTSVLAGCDSACFRALLTKEAP